MIGTILFYPITFVGLRGTTDQVATIPFHLDLFSAALVELAKSIPVHSLILSSNLFFCLPLFLFPFTVPCMIVFLNQKTLRHGQTILAFISWLGSGVCHILRWLLGSFCEPPHWLHGPYMKCSIAFSSISSQKPAFFSLTLQSRSMIHRHTEIWKWQGSTSASPLIIWSKRYVVISPNGFHLCKSCSGLCNPWENLWFGAIIWNNCSKVLEACYSAQLLSFYLYLSLDAIGTVCHQFGLLRTDLHLIPCAGFVETFY